MDMKRHMLFILSGVKNELVIKWRYLLEKVRNSY